MNHDDTTNTTGNGQDASDLQRWIDGLLQSTEAAELEVAPATTHVAANDAINQLRRRQIRRRSLAVVAAAAAIAAISLWTPPAPRELTAPGSARGSNDQAIIHRHATPGQRPGLQDVAQVARFESNGETIAIPLASDDPQVSIVKLYPTTTTERRWRRESRLQTAFAEPYGG
jgi:hypothetical protein